MSPDDQDQVSALAERVARLKAQAEYLERLATKLAGLASCVDLSTLELTTTRLNVPGLTVTLDRVDLVLSKLVEHARVLDAELLST